MQRTLLSVLRATAGVALAAVAGTAIAATPLKFSDDVADELAGLKLVVQELHSAPKLSRLDFNAWELKGRYDKALNCYMSRVMVEVDSKLAPGTPNSEVLYTAIAREAQVREAGALKLLYPKGLDEATQVTIKTLMAGPSSDAPQFRHQVAAVYKGREFQNCASPAPHIAIPKELQEPVNALAKEADRFNATRLVAASIEAVALKTTYRVGEASSMSIERIRNLVEWSSALQCVQSRYFEPEEVQRGYDLSSRLTRISLSYLATPRHNSPPSRATFEDLSRRAREMQADLRGVSPGVKTAMHYFSKYGVCY